MNSISQITWLMRAPIGLNLRVSFLIFYEYTPKNSLKHVSGMSIGVCPSTVLPPVMVRSFLSAPSLFF